MKSELGYVYLIWQSGTGFFKIGSSFDPQSRLKALQNSCPQKLVLACSIQVPEHVKFEKNLQRELVEHQIRGEWFLFCKSSLPLILKRFGLSEEFSRVLIDGFNTVAGKPITGINEAIENLDVYADFIPSKVVVNILTLNRGRRVTSETLRRWRREINIDPKMRGFYTREQVDLLLQLTSHLKRGGTLESWASTP